MKRYDIFTYVSHTTSWGEPCAVAELDVKEAEGGKWVKAEDVAELQAQLESMTAHRNRLQHIGIVILEDWWPLVHDRTCRQTVRAQGDKLRDAISND